MPKKQKITTILTITMLFALLVGGYFALSDNTTKQELPQIEENNQISETKSQNNISQNENIETVKINKANLEIEGVKYQAEIEKNTSVYDFMDKLRNNGEINFKDKTYIGLGKFIDEINGVKGNGSEFWIYYVNGKKAQIGVSNYRINPGDVVSWKYEKDID